MTGPRRSLLPRLLGRGKLTPVLTLILLGFILITIVSYLHTRRAAEQLAMGHARQALQFLNMELNSQVEELRRNLRQWSNEEIFTLATMDSYLGLAARKSANVRLLERIQGREIARVMLTNARGEIVASSDPNIIGAINVADRKFFARSMAGEQVLVSLPVGRYSPYPITVLSVGVWSKSQSDTAVGVLYLVLDTQRFVRRVLDPVRLGQSGGAVMVDLNSGQQFTPSWAKPGHFDLTSQVRALQEAAGTDRLVQYATSPQHAHDRQQRMAVSRLNDQTGWLLVVEADTEEILEPAAWLATVNGIIALSIILLAGLALAALNQALGGLRASEARYRSLIETSPLGIATFDHLNHPTFLNKRARNILGLAADSSLPPEWTLALEDEDGAPLDPSLQPVPRALLAMEPLSSWTVWWRAPGGDRKALSLNAASLDAQGQPRSVVLVMEDATDLHAARQVLQQSKQELEHLVARRTSELTEANRRLMELDELKSAFLSTVSHDLRTPLTSVLGFAKLIQREFAKRFVPQAQADSSQRKSATTILTNLDIIIHEGERLTRLITDLLDFSRLDSGRYQWNDAEVDLAELARNAARAMAAAYADKPEVVLRLDLPERVRSLRLDPDRMMQVIVNLLSNALKFTTQGEVRLFVQQAPERVVLGVADTGAGIAVEEQQRIFERFYQVGGKIETGKPMGSGLGLAICKQIVEHYGGVIRLNSHTGLGSTFEVELPCPAEATGGATARNP